MSEARAAAEAPARVGFLGVGWIGRHRMEAMLATGAIEAAAFADPSAEMAEPAPSGPAASRSCWRSTSTAS
jgi:predicted dehydrogenase